MLDMMAGILFYKIDHTNGDTNFVSVWTVDLEVITVYTEHRYSKETDLEIKTNLVYGNNIKSMSVLLSNEGIIAENRLSEFFNSISNGLVYPSNASIETWNKLFASKINIDMIRDEVLNSAVLHVDETPIKSFILTTKRRKLNLLAEIKSLFTMPIIAIGE